MRTHLVLAGLSVLALSACGAPSEPAKEVTDGSLTTSAPSATPTAAPTSSPTAAPSASAEASAAPKGPFHFTSYAGPKVKASITTAQVWNVQPVGLKNEWDILKMAREDFGRVEGDEVVVKHFDGTEIFVPGALVFPAAEAKGVKVGDVVLADVAAASAPARVTGIEGSGDEQRLKVKYLWGGSASDASLGATEVVKLEDKVVFGAPVAWKKDGTWSFGDCAGGDAATAFVITGSGHAELVDKKLVKALKITPIYKKGEKVWAGELGTLRPGKVVDVIDGGAGYKVKLDSGGSAETFELGVVTAPLE